MKLSYKKLNPLKRRIFKAATASLKNSKNLDKLNQIDKNSLKKVLITRANHRLGNQLLLSPLVQEIHNKFPNSQIDLVVNGSLSNILFSNYPYVNKVYNLPKKPFKNLGAYISCCLNLFSAKYDLGITGCETSNSSKILLKLSRAKYKIFNSGHLKKNKPLHLGKYPVYNFLSAYYNSNKTDFKYPKLNINLSETEIEQGKNLLSSFFENNNKVICFFTNATGSKKLSKKWWNEFYLKATATFIDYNFLEMLPKENISQIDFKSKNYYSQEIREMAAVIENSVLFIGADSGVMHLAASTNTTTLGLFKVTDPTRYQPYGNNNKPIHVKQIEIDQVIEEMKKVLH